MSTTTQDGADVKGCQATPSIELEQQLMDVRVPKNEREWWAQREISRLRAENERLSRELGEARAALGRDRDAFLTIMSSSAAEVDRARPADERDGPEWNGPGEEWWEAFEETVSDACFPGAPVFPTRAALQETSNG